MTPSGKETVPRRAAAALFWLFLRLGLIGFGGPSAHLALFRTVLVEQRGWLDAQTYDELVALCQFLPGPGSSQTAAAVGWVKAGPIGAFAALCGFALPSVVLMTAAGLGLSYVERWAGSGVLTGLMIAATGIVLSAVVSMARTQAASPVRASLAIGASVLIIAGSVLGVAPEALQPLAIVIGAGLGAVLLKPDTLATVYPIRRRGDRLGALLAISALLIGLFALAIVANQSEVVALANAHARAGALVFGGGHVVLPLLEAGVVPDFINDGQFLAGYGLAQTVPGPVFSVAAFIGAVAGEGAGQAIAFALVATLAIFAPGLALVFAALPLWAQLKRNRYAVGALAGAAASVTGLLAAALADPVLVSLPVDWRAYGLVATAFVAVHFIKAPAPLIVALAAALGAFVF